MPGGKEDKSIPGREKASVGSLRRAHASCVQELQGVWCRMVEAESLGLWLERKDQR